MKKIKIAKIRQRCLIAIQQQAVLYQQILDSKDPSELLHKEKFQSAGYRCSTVRPICQLCEFNDLGKDELNHNITRCNMFPWRVFKGIKCTSSSDYLSMNDAKTLAAEHRAIKRRIETLTEWYGMVLKMDIEEFRDKFCNGLTTYDEREVV